MNHCIIAVLLSVLMTGCTSSTNNGSRMNHTGGKNQNSQSIDTTPRVTGIGGIFFKTTDPIATREWYEKNLGLPDNVNGSPFEFRNANRPDEINYLIWSPFKSGTNYFMPSLKEFMINYRVQNIEGLIRNLKKNGVKIVDSIATYEYGKFVHIMDHDGNKIELWEPVDSILTRLGAKTVK